MTAAISDTAPLPVIAPHLEVRREVGQHGGWTVYEARRVDLNGPVTLRVGPLRSCTLGRDASQLAGAVARLKKLNHPALAEIGGAGVVDDQAYIELARLSGQPLAQYLEGRSLSEVQRLEVALQVAEALCYLHEHGIGYGAALDEGVWVERKPGSLRLMVKLVRWERVGKFTADGGDQRAFAELLKVITAGADAATGQFLTEMAARCGAAASDAPKFKNLAGELLTTIRSKNTALVKLTLVHLAEPLDVNAPKVVTRSAASTVRGDGSSNSAVGWRGAAAVIAIAVGALSAAITNQNRTGLPRPSLPSPPTSYSGSVLPGSSSVPGYGAVYGSPSPPSSAATPPMPTAPHRPNIDPFRADVTPPNSGIGRPRWTPPSGMERGFPQPRSGIRVDLPPNHSPPGGSMHMSPPTQAVPGGFQPPHFGR